VCLCVCVCACVRAYVYLIVCDVETSTMRRNGPSWAFAPEKNMEHKLSPSSPQRDDFDKFEHRLFVHM